MKRRKPTLVEILSLRATRWVGTPVSLVVHTILFVLALLLAGILHSQEVLNILTNVVSLEAIYLTIFVQMSVNRQHKSIKEIAQDIDDILEDTEELTEEEKIEVKRIIGKTT